MKTVVAIPVKNEFEFTKSIVDHVLDREEVDLLVVLDNGCTDETPAYLADQYLAGRRIQALRRDEAGIYDLWNEALDLARVGPGPVNLVLLNNDLDLIPGTIAALVTALRSDDRLWAVSPDPDVDFDTFDPETTEFAVRRVKGTYRNGGLLGYAFAVAVEKWPPGVPLVDPRFSWWYGDDDLAWTIDHHGGRIGRLVGLPVRHIDGGAKTSRHDPTIAERIARDEALFAEKWPGR